VPLATIGDASRSQQQYSTHQTAYYSNPLALSAPNAGGVLHVDFIPYEWKQEAAVPSSRALPAVTKPTTHGTNNFDRQLHNSTTVGLAATTTRASQLAVSAWFATTDSDRDGFITGEEARNFFAQSRVPFEILAEIWASFPKTRYGHLDENEFAYMFEMTQKHIPV
jgi:hypothetical protein